MKKTQNLFVLLVLLLICNACKKDKRQDQNFEKTYGGAAFDSGASLLAHDNALYILGTTHSFNDPLGDHYLLKVDLKGNVIWEKTYGGVALEQGVDLIASCDGNILLVGTTASIGAGSNDVQLMKIHKDGKLIWEQTFGGPDSDGPADIIETKNGDICIVGTTYSFGAGNRDIYLIRLDADGNTIYEKYFGAIEHDGASAILELENQDLMIFAYTLNYGAVSRDVLLLKTNAQGDSIWSQRYGSEEYEESQAFAKTTNHEFILTGHSAATDPAHQMYGWKIDAAGQMLWSKEFGGIMHEGGEALLIDKVGNYVFVGVTMSFGAGNMDVYMVKTDNNGNILSEDYFGGPEDDKIEELIEYKGFYYMVGFTNSSGFGGADLYLVKKNVD